MLSQKFIEVWRSYMIADELATTTDPESYYKGHLRIIIRLFIESLENS